MRARLRTAGAALVAAVMVATGGIAVAHTFTAPTSLSITASRHVVDPGDRVTFSGRLQSPRRFCRRHSRIQLVHLRSGNVVGTDVTNRRGRWVITKRARRGIHRYFARFNGKTRGVHPHRHTCNGSRSGFVKVRTR